MNLSAKGIARTVFAAAAGAGLVAGAMQVSGAVAVGPTTNPDSVREGSTTTVKSSEVVCPGPELRGVEGLPDLPVDTTVWAATAPVRALTGLRLPEPKGSITMTGIPSGGSPAPATARGAVTSKAYSKAGAAVVRGTQSLAPGLAASQSSLTTSGDQRGLVSVACGRPSADSWLIGGAGQPGRQERLLLTNPGANAVSVDLTLFGAKGQVDSPNGKGVVVPARSRTTVLLDAISGTETTPVVHVEANGGVVHAVLNDYWLDGSTPAGSDDAVATAAPSRDQVIPALPVAGKATLRVAVPGDGEAVVQARALTATGPKALPKGSVVRLAGGSARDITLEGLPDGFYGIQVRADVPIVAGAVAERRTPAAGELAWSSSTEPISGVAGALLVRPSGTSTDIRRALTLAVTGDSAGVEVVTVDSKGKAESKRLTVAEDVSTSVVVPAEAASVWVHRVSGKGLLRAGLISWAEDDQGQLISSMPLSDTSLRTTNAGLVELPQ